MGVAVVKSCPDRVAWKAAERARLGAQRAMPKRIPSLRLVKTVRAKRQCKPVALRPFVGVDGEGAGQDDIGRQHYMLLRAGDRELWTGAPLSTWECLDFLCDCPATKSAILVGFSFGYDVTMILRDLPSERRAHLLSDKPMGSGKSRYTYWSGDKIQSHGFGIEYLKNNYFRVCRTLLHRVQITREDGSREWVTYPRAVPGSSRTIYETFGFFQTSFLKTLHAWDVGTVAQRAEIETNKAERGDVAIGPRQRDYCAMECDFLAQLMEQFREVCLAPEVNIKPRTWNGAGKLSAALHASYGTITAEKLALRLSDTMGPRAAEFLSQASAAYYGGRFEVTRIGAIDGPIWEYDIRSAYPAAMESLPCLEHGRWVEVSPEQLCGLDPAREIFVAPLRFTHAKLHRANAICGFPIRQKGGRLFWPVQGGGVYWSCEIAAAYRLGAMVAYDGPGWRYVRQCECHAFPWVRALYEARRAIGADRRGFPIKLGINGLYGKLAQRIGNPKFANLIWAGLITALTRAALIGAAASDPEAVIMFATDALFTTRPLDVSQGDELGQWEAKRHDRLFIVQPGIYWGASRPKMRGVPDSVLTKHVDRFESAWRDYAERDRAAERAGFVAPPKVTVPIRLFTGIRVAQARGKPETAGIWTEGPRTFDYSWHVKRGRHVWKAGHVITSPAAGSPGLWSRPHVGDAQLTLALDLEKAELAEQPDMVDLSPPWST